MIATIARRICGAEKDAGLKRTEDGQLLPSTAARSEPRSGFNRKGTFQSLPAPIATKVSQCATFATNEYRRTDAFTRYPRGPESTHPHFRLSKELWRLRIDAPDNMEPVQTNFRAPAKTWQRAHTIAGSTWTVRLKQIAARTLGYGPPTQAVLLPQGENLNELLAALTLDFYNETRVLYSALSEVCTPVMCPMMSAGPKFEYLWVDAGAEPQHVSAPVYIDCLFSWAEEKLEDESLFPVTQDLPFACSFLPTVKVIWKRLFRVYAHLYHSHYLHIVALGLDSHLNTSFRRFLFFVDQFQLVHEEELVPLDHLVREFRSRNRGDSTRL